MAFVKRIVRWTAIDLRTSRSNAGRCFLTGRRIRNRQHIILANMIQESLQMRQSRHAIQLKRCNVNFRGQQILLTSKIRVDIVNFGLNTWKNRIDIGDRWGHNCRSALLETFHESGKEFRFKTLANEISCDRGSKASLRQHLVKPRFATVSAAEETPRQWMICPSQAGSRVQ